MSRVGAAFRFGLANHDGTAALDLASIGRTPPTIFLRFELATRLEFDLGGERFTDQLDPDALKRRSARAVSALRSP